MIFIDPGVKTFLTGYDPSGKIITFGSKENSKRIAMLLHFKNKLQKKLKLQQTSKNNKLRIALLRINKKIHNLISDLHYKSSKWLLENYKCIYLPRLNFHNFKKLNKKSKTLLSRYRHCEFLDKLSSKGQNVFEVNESYTSKTCSNCGNLHESLLNKDIYNCDCCKIKIGRDINASRNIMLRYFSNRAFVREPCGLAPGINIC
jgi:putative transposase